MSIFSKAWRVVKTARRVIGVVADVGDAVISILNIGIKPIKKFVDAAEKVDEAVSAVEKASAEKTP